MLGCHYGDIGAMLLENWNLPAELQMLVRFHPTPAQAPESRLETALLHLAHAYAGQNIAANPLDAEALIDKQVWLSIGLPQKTVNECLATARQVSLDIGRGLAA